MNDYFISMRVVSGLKKGAFVDLIINAPDHKSPAQVLTRQVAVFAKVVGSQPDEIHVIAFNRI